MAWVGATVAADEDVEAFFGGDEAEAVGLLAACIFPRERGAYSLF
jgi:hypothetical protein